jgi:proteasome lid subunit RPN8/RPN11
MKTYVQTVKKNWRMNMKNKENNPIETTETQILTNPKQTTRKSNLPAEKKQRRLALRFSPTAWAKLLYFRDKSDNEVGGFAITEVDDLLFVKDFVTVKQEVTSVSVKFNDAAVADFFDTQVDLGRKPEQFARIWLHTHPGDSAEPSMIDEETFQRVFGVCQWAVIFVIAQNNKTFARLRFNVGPSGQVLIPVEVDYTTDFGASDKAAWDDEYQVNVKAITWLSDISNKDEKAFVRKDYGSLALPYDFLEEFEEMEPAERQFILDELADRPDLWDEEEVRFYEY